MSTIIVELTREEAYGLTSEAASALEETEYYLRTYPDDFSADDFESFGERKAAIDSATAKIEAALSEQATPHSGKE